MWLNCAKSQGKHSQQHTILQCHGCKNLQKLVEKAVSQYKPAKVGRKVAENGKKVVNVKSFYNFYRFLPTLISFLPTCTNFYGLYTDITNLQGNKY